MSRDCVPRHLTKYSTIAEFLASKCLGEFDKCNQAELGGRIEEEQRVKQELTAAEQIILAQRKELDRSVPIWPAGGQCFRSVPYTCYMDLDPA